MERNKKATNHKNILIAETSGTNERARVRIELYHKIMEKGYNLHFFYRGHGPIKEYVEGAKELLVSTNVGRDIVNPIKELRLLWKEKIVMEDNEISRVLVYGTRIIPRVVVASKLAVVDRIVCVIKGSGRLFYLDGIKGFLTRLISFPLLSISLFLTDRVYFQNEDDMNLFKKKKLLLRSNYYVVNGSGVNLEAFRPMPLPSENSFLMISRLTKHKGVNEFVQAAQIIKKLYPESTFSIVGSYDDTDFSIDKHFLLKCEEEGIVSLIGQVKDVRPYIARSRCYILPSYYEGTSRTVLEAMAMGRPIITTDAPGCRGTVSEGGNGFLVPVGDVNALVDRILWIIEHPEHTEEMGLRSRKICEDKYDVCKINDVMLDALEG